MQCFIQVSFCVDQSEAWNLIPSPTLNSTHTLVLSQSLLQAGTMTYNKIKSDDRFIRFIQMCVLSIVSILNQQHIGTTMHVSFIIAACVLFHFVVKSWASAPQH